MLELELSQIEANCGALAFKDKQVVLYTHRRHNR